MWATTKRSTSPRGSIFSVLGRDCALLSLLCVSVGQMWNDHNMMTAEAIEVDCGDGSKPPEYVIEMIHLQDLSGSFGEDLPHVQRLLPEVFRDFAAGFSGSRFGCSSYIDKPGTFGSYYDYCYKQHSPLTSDIDDIKRTLSKMSVKGGGDTKESQMEALMHAALTEDLGWTKADADPETGRPIQRIISLSTDADFHIAPDGVDKYPSTFRPNDGDAILDCSSEDYPSLEQVKNGLQSRNIIPLFLVTANAMHYYENALKEWDIFGVVLTLDADSENILDAITDGLTTIMCRSTTTTTPKTTNTTPEPTTASTTTTEPTKTQPPPATTEGDKTEDGSGQEDGTTPSDSNNDNNDTGGSESTAAEGSPPGEETAPATDGEDSDTTHASTGAPPPPSGLSTAAIAGVAVGATVGAGAVAGGAYTAVSAMTSASSAAAGTSAAAEIGANAASVAPRDVMTVVEADAFAV